jgi:3-phenylpropionate/cinnamic acid dioxygenase small subunit
MLSIEDRLAIHDIVSLYGHLIDERQWDRLDEMFTDDVIYDLDDFGLGVSNGMEAVRAMWADESLHPLAHHATNVLIHEAADGEVRVVSKGIGVGKRGKVGSVTYHDRFVRTERGWRIGERVAILRRPHEAIDAARFAGRYPPGAFAS